MAWPEQLNCTWKSLTPVLLSWESTARLARPGAGGSWQQRKPADKTIFLLSLGFDHNKIPTSWFPDCFPGSAISLVPLKISWAGSPVLPFPVYGHRCLFFYRYTEDFLIHSPPSAKYNAHLCWGTQQRLSFSSQPTQGPDTEEYIPLSLLQQSPSHLPHNNKPPSSSLPCKIQVFPP